MKLYFSKGSCSLAVRIIINEIGLKSEFEAVDLKNKKDAEGDNYLNVNPKGAVPALYTDDKHLLTENAVIQQYLADTHKAYQLLPQLGDYKRYQVLEWLNFVATDLHKGFGPLFNPNVPIELKNDIFIPNLKMKFSFVDKQLQTNKYLLGDSFTLPDGYLFVMLLWAHGKKIDLSDCPALEKYFLDLKQRPSIQLSLQQEGL